MPMMLADIEAEAVKLPKLDREILADWLISTLDEKLDAQWANEAERRYAAYQAGEISARPAVEAIGDALATLPHK